MTRGAEDPIEYSSGALDEAVARFRPQLGAPINRKLGGSAHTWSIPALTTCPGATAECSSCCYALSGFLSYPSVRATHERNYAFSHTDHFVAWMRSQLIREGVRLLRVHVAGDFYSGAYVRKWIAVARAVPHVRFWAYTRSWRTNQFAIPDPDMRPALAALSELSNVALWLSEDSETGAAPRAVVPRARRAFMARTDARLKLVPKTSSLVFRNSTATVVKRVGTALVCPVENGTKPLLKLTCATCQLCFNPSRARHLPPAPLQ